MPVIRVVGFDGEIPRRAPTMLGDNQAQAARNVKLHSQELRPWRSPVLAYDPGFEGVMSFYALSKGPDSLWLAWLTAVRAVTSPLAEDSDSRLYYTGDGSPKKTTYDMALAAGAPYTTSYYEMGVPAPATPLVATPEDAGIADLYLNIKSSVGVAEGPSGVTGPVTRTQKWVSYSGSNDKTEWLAPIPLESGGTYRRLKVTDYVMTQAGLYSPHREGLLDQVSITRTPTGVIVAPFDQSSSEPAAETIDTAPPVVDTRAYIYTFVSSFGTLKEESAPSPPSQLITTRTDRPVALTGFASPPAGAYNITHIRIYRSVTGETTDSYQFLDEIEIGTTSYNDGASIPALGEVVPTIGWDVPPTDLDGLISLPYGSLAGFSGKTVYFSEPYYPHAWPSAYGISVPHPIIGLGVIGASVVVMTTAYPYIISGLPGSQSTELVPINEPCVAPRSITSDEAGVIYASPNGLVTIGMDGRGLISTPQFSRTEWQEIVNTGMSAEVYDGRYFCITRDPARPLMVFNRREPGTLTFLEIAANDLWVSPEQAQLYYAATDDSCIYQVDANPIAFETYTWRSKRFALPRGVTLSAFQIDADFQALIDPSRSLLMDVYADQALLASYTVTDRSPLRLPAARYRELEFELRGNLDVRSVALGTTVSELRNGE